jgi:uncharacterized membrane protein YgcG
MKGLRIAGLVLLGVLGAALFALVFGWLVMLLWNWLMPVIFHLGEITYWQAFGIVVLGKLLFGGIGGHHGGRGPRFWRGGPGGGSYGRGHARDEWRWYNEFWRQEGREAFERFMQKKNSESAPGGSPPASS